MAHRKRWPKGTWMRLRSPDTLRALMKQSNLSFKDLGDLAGVHKSFISHLLAGRRYSCLPEKADRIAMALHVPTEVLFQAKQSTTSTSGDKQKVTAA
jgi:transcriptional regulator with XRE-family HTH domain